MKLEAALTYLYSSHINKIELTNPFIVYSNLSDMCNDSFKNKSDAKAYWNIISRINIFEHLINNGIACGLEELLKKYSEYSEYFSYSEYEKMINYTIAAMGIKSINKRKQATNELCGFNIKDGILYSYKGRKSILTIPENVKIIKTNAIDGLANIKKIIIPSTVEKIEAFAINNLSNLEEIQLGNIKKIDEYAFWNCNGLINNQ